MSIHLTNAPEIPEDKTVYYTVVSNMWQNIVIGMIVVIMFGVVFLGYTLHKMENDLQKETLQTAIWKQRVDAMNELLINRSINQRFSYGIACEVAKEKGKPCIDNPTWWANPKKYPLLVDDPAGYGLFPIETPEQK